MKHLFSRTFVMIDLEDKWGAVINLSGCRGFLPELDVPGSLILVVINTNFHRLEQFLPSANVTNPFTINSSLCGCSNIHCFANKSSIFYTCLRTLYVLSSDVKQRRIEIKQILCCLEIFQSEMFVQQFCQRYCFAANIYIVVYLVLIITAFMCLLPCITSTCLTTSV